MSKEYIIVAANRNDCFLTWGGNWSAEYPNARKFPNLQSARRTRDTVKDQTMIYTTTGYEQGTGPQVGVNS